MSDYGLIIKNTSGQVQIDSKYINFVEMQDTSGAVTQGWDKTIAITNTIKIPLIAAKAPTGGAFLCHRGLVKSGDTFTHGSFCASASFTAYIKCFVTGPLNALPTYGLVVKNLSDNVVFHNNDTPMKIVSVNTGTFAPVDPYVYPVAYSDETVVDAANNYFILTPVFPIVMHCGVISYSPPINYMFVSTRGFGYVNSTTVRVSQLIMQTFVGTLFGISPYSDWVNDYTLIEVAA